MHNSRKRLEMLARTVRDPAFEPIIFVDNEAAAAHGLPPRPGGWTICRDRTGQIYKAWRTGLWESWPEP